MTDQLQSTLLQKYKQFYSEKAKKISCDDQPWFTENLKILDRKRKRIFCQERKSEKYRKIDKQFKVNLKKAKNDYYTNKIAKLKQARPSKWYSEIKKITNQESKSELLNIESIY